MESHDAKKSAVEQEPPEPESEDSEPGFESSQRVTYGSESIVNKSRKLNHGKLGGDFAKRLLCKAVKSSRRNGEKADELKELNLL